MPLAPCSPPAPLFAALPTVSLLQFDRDGFQVLPLKFTAAPFTEPGRRLFHRRSRTTVRGDRSRRRTPRATSPVRRDPVGAGDPGGARRARVRPRALRSCGVHAGASDRPARRGTENVARGCLAGG